MPAHYFTGNRSPVAAPLNALDTPNKRARHTAARHALWVSIAGKRGGVSLGYRARVDQPGSWSARLIYRGARHETLLGVADDPGCKPDALSYAAAAQAALTWAEGKKASLESGKDVDGDPDDPTLRDALATYCEARIRRAAAAGTNAMHRLTRHVLSDSRLADTRLTRLSPASIAGWRRGLLPMKPSSLNRLLNDLRAGITAAMPAQILPPELRAALRAEPGATEAREIQVIYPADLRRLLEAADQLDASFGQLVRLLAVTGARYSQVVKLRVNDLQLVPGRNRLMVPASAKGRGAKAGRLIPVPISDDVAARLRPLTYGRMGHEALLGLPLDRANRMIRQWRLALDAAGLSTTLVPYALRHTSIVRMLSQNVPIRFVAAVHDTSIAMLENHYAKFVTNEVEDRIRRAVVSFESAEIVTLPERQQTVAASAWPSQPSPHTREEAVNTLAHRR
jgi:integrase